MTVTVSVGVAPYGNAIHPAGTFVYVANFGSNSLSVIDLATHTVKATPPVGEGPVAFGLFLSSAPTVKAN